MITKTRKAINFDLDNNLLKQNYPSKNYKNAWRDIKKYFEDENLFIVSIQAMYLKMLFQ